MDGGVDAAITAFFGTQLQERVPQHIIREYLGEPPVGTTFVIETGNREHPWLVYAPTMRVHQCCSMWQLLKKVHHFMGTTSPFPGGKHGLAKV